MKSMYVCFAILLLLAFSNRDKLTGKWQSQPSVNGNVTSVVFNENKLEAFVNKKPFASGEYVFHNDTLSFVDNGCDGKRGEYLVIFFNNDDSLRFRAIRDSCDERKNGMERLIMGRVK